MVHMIIHIHINTMHETRGQPDWLIDWRFTPTFAVSAISWCKQIIYIKLFNYKTLRN